jgi:type I restriction enzyme, S subunit
MNKSYTFYVTLDHETSERVGAGGMFQVARIKDDNEKDRTSLVDQGKHYNTLDELKDDLAEKLHVSASEISLEILD